MLQVEVRPLGTFGGEQCSNDRFARVGFVRVDLVDHHWSFVDNAAGHRAIPRCRTRASAEQTRRAELFRTLTRLGLRDASH